VDSVIYRITDRDLDRMADVAVGKAIKAGCNPNLYKSFYPQPVSLQRLGRMTVVSIIDGLLQDLRSGGVASQNVANLLVRLSNEHLPPH